MGTHAIAICMVIPIWQKVCKLNNMFPVIAKVIDERESVAGKFQQVSKRVLSLLSYTNMSEKKFELRGKGGLLTVFDDKVIIEVKGVLGFLAQGLAGGKTIPMEAIQSVQFRKGVPL